MIGSERTSDWAFGFHEAISKVIANCYLDRSQKMLDCIPAPFRFISDTGVDMSWRVQGNNQV